MASRLQKEQARVRSIWSEYLGTSRQTVNVRSIGSSGIRTWLESWADWCFQNTDDADLWRSAKLTADADYNDDTGKMVYFIRSAEGPIKIGMAYDVSSRQKELQSSNPNELHCIVAVPGGLKLERALHHALKKYRVRGEWFAVSAPLMALIERLLWSVTEVETKKIGSLSPGDGK